MRGAWRVSRVDQSFDDCYAVNYKRLTAQLYAFVGDLEEVQDLVQEAFVRAWPRWSQISEYEDPVGWVRRVAWNLATGHWRRIRTALRHAGMFRLEVAEGPGPDRVALVRALGRLPAAPPQTTTGPPAPPQSTTGPPAPPQTTSGPPAPPQTTSGPAAPPQTTSGPAAPPQTTSGPAAPPQSTTGPPAPPQSTTGPPGTPVQTCVPISPPPNTRRCNPSDRLAVSAAITYEVNIFLGLIYNSSDQVLEWKMAVRPYPWAPYGYQEQSPGNNQATIRVIVPAA